MKPPATKELQERLGRQESVLGSTAYWLGPFPLRP